MIFRSASVLHLGLALLASGIPCSSGLIGQLWSEVRVPVPGSIGPASLFGWSLALDDEVLVVGAPRADLNGADKGAVFVFQRDLGGLGQWEQLQALVPPELGPGAQFGTAIELKNELLLVSAPFDVVNGVASGAIYEYARQADDSFVLQERIVPAGPVYDQRFGAQFVSAEIDMIPRLLLSGGPGFDCDRFFPYNCLGRVSVLLDATGNDLQVVDEHCPPPGSTSGCGFAQSLAVVTSTQATTVAMYHQGLCLLTDLEQVGLPDGTDNGPWPVTDTLEASNAGNAQSTVSGSSLATSADHLFAAGYAFGHRAVLTFNSTGNELEQDGIMLPDTNVIVPEHRFGYAIAPDRSVESHGSVAVGAPGVEIGALVGSCYVYARDEATNGGWRPVVRLVPSDAELGALFGHAVALSGAYVAVGSPAHGSEDHGQVYVFTDPAATDGTLGEARAGPVVFPDPVRTTLYVRGWSAPSSRYAIHDLLGHVLSSGEVEQASFKIDVEDMASGVYLLSIDGGTNRVVLPFMHD